MYKSRNIRLLACMTAALWLLLVPAYGFHDPPSDTGHAASIPPNPIPPSPPPCPDDECNAQPGDTPASCLGSPVYVQTGDFFTTIVDFFLPGKGLPLRLARSYNTQEEFNGAFGYRWVSNHTAQLVRFSDGENDFAQIRLANGRRAKFIKNQDGTYTGLDTLIYDELIDNGDGTFTLNPNCGGCTKSPLPEIQFNTNGFPSLMVDLKGNALTFAYTPTSMLQTVTDSSGRQLTYAYGSNKKIISVTFPNAEVMYFGYDSYDNLISVTDPTGATTQYVYDSDHRLIVIKDPEDRFTLQVTYDDRGRVATYAELGDTFEYEYVPGSNQTRVRDSDGNLTTYTYDERGVITGINTSGIGTTQVVYDEDHRPTSVTDENNKTWVYTYDDEGNVVTQTDPLGNSWTYTYDLRFNSVATTTDPLGNTTSFEYDNNGNKTKRTDALGNFWTFTFDAAGQMLTETDPLLETTAFTYDTNGNLTSITDALGGLSAFTYDIYGNVLTSTDANGNTSTNTYDELGRLLTGSNPLGETTTYTYDGSGNKLSGTDPTGGTTSFKYDETNHLTEIKDPLGSATNFTYDPKGNVVSTTDPMGNAWGLDYDKRNLLLSETDPLGNSKTSTYDKTGKVLTETDEKGSKTTLTYDAADHVTRVTDGAGKVFTSEYDAAGLLVKTTDPDGNERTLSMNALGRVVAQTDAMGNGSQVEFDALGNRTKTIDALGNETSFTFDALGRLITTTDALGNVLSYEYDAVGNRTGLTYPNGTVIAYTYDAANRVTGFSDTSGTFISYTYDAAGRRISKSDGAGNTESYTYDAAGRQTVLTLQDGTTQNYTYNAAGKLLSMLLQEAAKTGASMTYAIDELGRVSSQTDAEGTMSLVYDAAGNIQSVTDQGGNTTSYTYDSLNRRTSETYPDASQTTMTYDWSGLLLSKTTPSGTALTFTYDLNGNLLTTTAPGISDTNTYDAKNRLLTATNSAGTVSYTYDALGRVTQESQPYGAVDYSYDLSAKTRTMTYPSGLVVTEQMDSRDRLSSVTAGATTHVTYGYDNETDKLSGATFGNGIVGAFNFDERTQLMGMDYSLSAATVWGRTITRDTAGRITAEDDVLDGDLSRSYVYDGLGRLSQSIKGKPSPLQTTTYDLDSVGNWNSVDVDAATTTATSNNLNQYTVFDGTAFTYDADGNLSNDGDYTYTYDAFNRLTQVADATTSEVQAAFVYDALGRRIEKIAGGVSTRFTYDSVYRVIEEEDGADALVARYTYGPSINALLTMERGANTYFYIRDQRGSVMQVRDGAGALVESYDYGPYGEVSVFDSAGGAIPASAISNPFLFTGQYLDSETGLYFMRARYYSPKIGRFISRDPLGFVDSFNLYEYAVSSPVMMIDPKGLSGFSSSTAFSSGHCTLSFNVAFDAGGKIQKLLKRAHIMISKRKFKIGGSFSYKVEQCQAKCCNLRTGEWHHLIWDQRTIQGQINLSFSGVIPGAGIEIPGAQAGLIGFVEVVFLGYGQITKVPDNECNLQDAGKMCIELKGTIGLRLGIDASGEDDDWFGGKAYLEGGITPSGKVCYDFNTGWSGEFCIAAHMKLVVGARIGPFSAGGEMNVAEGKYCF